MKEIKQQKFEGLILKTGQNLSVTFNLFFFAKYIKCS